MLPLTLSRLQRLLVPRVGPCLSVYLPARGSAATSGRSALRQVREIREALRDHAESSVATLVAAPVEEFLSAPARTLPGQAVAVFSSPRLRGWYPLPGNVTSRVVVADSFHVKPILDHLVPWGTWYLLDVNLPQAALYRGRGRALERVRVLPFSGPGYRSHGYRARRALWWTETLVEEAGAPVFVSAHDPVRSLLLAEPSPVARVDLGRYLNAPHASEIGLLERAWPQVGPWWERTRRTALADLSRALAMGIASGDLSTLVDDAVHGRLRSLAIRSDLLARGRLAFDHGRFVAVLAGAEEPRAGEVGTVGEAGPGPGRDCVFDDLAERALLHGTDVFVCEAGELPPGVPAIGLPRRPDSNALLA